VIPNGVGTEPFDSCVGQPPVRESAGRTAIFAGNLAPYQGIELMLKAFAGLARVRADVRVKIVTEGDSAPYRSLPEQLGIHDRIDVVPAGCEKPLAGSAGEPGPSPPASPNRDRPDPAHGSSGCR
jgi:glycosyltransferase involved in cell wall biosynthesis